MKFQHRWGRKVNPMTAPVLLNQDAINKWLVPLHMAVELLPLGLFTKAHAEHVAKLINLISVDSVKKEASAWEAADEAGEVLRSMFQRVNEGKAWNCTVEERKKLTRAIMVMDKHLRTWTNRRFTLATMTVNEINRKAKAAGGQFLDQVAIT